MNSYTKEMAFFPSNFSLETDALHEDDHHQPQISLNPNLLPPQDFKSMTLSGSIHHHEVNCHEETKNKVIINHMEDMSDDEDGLSQAGGEKKRRLKIEQVKMLEKNFELGNKLEPDRKLQLALSLGLQPRQIAIWFQNRRARWKTKQLEKDYQLLKRHFDAIKAENDSLISQNQELHAQILALKNKDPAELINLNKETEGSCSNTSENSSDVNLYNAGRTIPAIDSHRNITSRSSALFPSNNRQPSNTSISLSFASRPEIQAQKLDHRLHQTVREESFSNMLCGIEDQAGFWPWLEQQQFS